MTTASNKLTDFFSGLISLIHKAVFLWICVIVLFMTNLTIPIWVKKEFLLGNLPLAALGFVALFLAMRLFKDRPLNPEPILIAGFVLQVLMIWFYHYNSGWDAGTVSEKAWQQALVGTVETPELYYSYYTNNILMHLIEYGIFRLCILAGVTDFEIASFVLVILGCMLSAFGGYLVTDILKMMLPGSRIAVRAGLLIYLLLVMLSPWFSVIYTDSLGVAAPVFLIWIYMKASENGAQKGRKIFLSFLFGAAAVFAYRLKATSAVATIAVSITFLMDILRAVIAREKITGYLRALVCSILALVISAGLFRAMYVSCGIVLDPEQACPFTHYLMMGFNDYEAGTFNFEDSDSALFIPKYDDRYEYCLSEAKKRIKALLPFGIFMFEARKTLVNYNDGTFGYGIEGDFYSPLYDDKDQVFSPFLKKLFIYEGEYYQVLASAFHALWLVVLVLNLFFLRSPDRKKGMVIQMTLIGIFLFLCLFEARARYVFIYVPVYITGAAAGAENISSFWRKRFG